MKTLNVLLGVLIFSANAFAYTPHDLVGRAITCHTVSPEPYERTHDVVYAFLGNFKGMDLVKVSPDFGYGPEGGETRTYKVSRKGLLSIQYMTSDLVLIAGETNLDLNEFVKNNGVIQRKTVVSESSLDEDGSTTYRSGVRLETCTLK